MAKPNIITWEAYREPRKETYAIQAKRNNGRWKTIARGIPDYKTAKLIERTPKFQAAAKLFPEILANPKKLADIDIRQQLDDLLEELMPDE